MRVWDHYYYYTSQHMQFYLIPTIWGSYFFFVSEFIQYDITKSVLSSDDFILHTVLSGPYESQLLILSPSKTSHTTNSVKTTIVQHVVKSSPTSLICYYKSESINKPLLAMWRCCNVMILFHSRSSSRPSSSRHSSYSYLLSTWRVLPQKWRYMLWWWISQQLVLLAIPCIHTILLGAKQHTMFKTCNAK